VLIFRTKGGTQEVGNSTSPIRRERDVNLGVSPALHLDVRETDVRGETCDPLPPRSRAFNASYLRLLIDTLQLPVFRRNIKNIFPLWLFLRFPPIGAPASQGPRRWTVGHRDIKCLFTRKLPSQINSRRAFKSPYMNACLSGARIKLSFSYYSHINARLNNCSFHSQITFYFVAIPYWGLDVER